MLQAHDCSIVASQQVVNSNIMARFSVIFALLLVCTGVFASVEYAHFEKWISERGIEVKNPDKAWSVWKENVEFVYRHNSLGLSYKLALNDFAHLTPKELTGEGLQVSPAVPHTSFQAVSDPLPPSIDWRKKGAVTPVKNQGQCGSASAFATVDSVASYSIIETGKLVMPSIDEYVDCCLNGSCNGGFFGVFRYQCIAKLGGLACDYIPNANRTCLSKEFEPCVMIDGGSQVMPAGDEKALAAALVKQPIAVAVDASHTSFQLYASGVYYEPACSSEKLDHAMLLAGYGTLDGEDYWLVKNSWGSSWGIDGYIMMARNKNNNCGIATTAIYPN